MESIEGASCGLELIRVVWVVSEKVIETDNCSVVGLQGILCCFGENMSRLAGENGSKEAKLLVYIIFLWGG